MCTVTWSYRTGGYDLLMNRDELHERGPALPPQERTTDGVHFLAPIDTDADGTWIAVNELGVTVGLLNRYPAGYAPSTGLPFRSRGKLVLSLAGAGSAADAVEALLASAVSDYRPFTFFAMDDAEIDGVVWDGDGDPRRFSPQMPLSSSSFRGAEVVAARQALFERELAGAGGTAGELRSPDRIPVNRLRAFHAAHDPERGAFSVCMKRPDAATKSFSHVSVDRDTVRFHYHDGAPCDDSPDTMHTLEREPSR